LDKPLRITLACNREDDGKVRVPLTWTRLSCTRYVSNQVRLALFVLAYNLGNFLRRFALPREVSHWSLTSIQLKLVKIGAKIISYSRMTVFQMAEVAVPEKLFRSLLSRIHRLGRAFMRAPTLACERCRGNSMAENQGQLLSDNGKPGGLELRWRGQSASMPQNPLNRA